jgi:hypothetical protein
MRYEETKSLTEEQFRRLTGVGIIGDRPRLNFGIILEMLALLPLFPGINRGLSLIISS